MSDETVISNELREIKERLEKEVEGSELVTCVRAHIRVSITRTQQKSLGVCLQFPPDGYPVSPIILELKSKTLDEKLLDGLTRVCDQEAKKLQGQKQVIPMLKFLRDFIDQNPLCCCSKEINDVKKNILEENDELKIRQKDSAVVVKASQGKYTFSYKITVPDDYPVQPVLVEEKSNSFPPEMRVYFRANAAEIARKCTQAPLNSKKAKTWQPRPSLAPVLNFLIKDGVKRFPLADCPLCGRRSFPPEPSEVIVDPSADLYVEKVYCGHLFHHKCLDAFMKTPPFDGGKKCPECEKRIYHSKWNASPEVAEARWAHEQAKHRELADVVDFLGDLC